MYLDSHAHLDAADFDADREAVIARARGAGLQYVLLIADLAKPESVRSVAELVERHDWMYWAAGIDPHESAKAREEQFAELAKAGRHPKFLAVGEIGLDYYYDYPRDVQQRVFRRQIELARDMHKPIIIHCRDAWSDLRQVLREYFAFQSSAANNELPETAQGAGILHCFTGSIEDARDLIDLGFYVSFASNLTFKKAADLREAARSLPVDRLLSETDCPYLAPVPYRGRRNEPAFVREVTKALAALHEMPEEEMGRRLARNFERLFELNGRPQ